MEDRRTIVLLGTGPKYGVYLGVQITRNMTEAPPELGYTGI